MSTGNLFSEITLDTIIISKFVDGKINQELAKVVKIDIVGIIILVIGFVLFKFQ